MSYEYDTATPYAASYVLLRRAEEIAFVLRAKGWMKGHYGLVSGKKEKEEGFMRAGTREAEEEGGVIIQSADLRHVLTMSRYEVNSGQDWVDIFFEATKWEGEPHNAEPGAHSELTFFAPDNLPKNVVPSVRFALEAIEAGKTYAEYGWD
jgi:8-oxo-dGTP pyrophosphatase MutT (NUDIX family)